MPELLHILKKRGARPSLVLVMVLLIPGFWNAQTRELDSLKNRVRTSIKDTNALNALTQLAWQFVRTGSSDSAIGPCKRALALCDELEKHAKNDNELFCIRKTQGRCFNYLGLQKRDISDFNAALEYMERSVNVFGDMEKNLPAFHDQVILLKSKTMANMAVIYHLKGDNVKALELNFNVKIQFQCFYIIAFQMIDHGHVGHGFRFEEDDLVVKSRQVLFHIPEYVNRSFHILQGSVKIGDVAFL